MHSFVTGVKEVCDQTVLDETLMVWVQAALAGRTPLARFVSLDFVLYRR